MNYRIRTASFDRPEEKYLLVPARFILAHAHSKRARRAWLVIAAAVFACGLFVSTGASATCVGQLCNNVQITRIYTSGGNTNLRTSGDEDALDCDPGTGDYLAMRRTDDEYEDWYALVLTAFAQEMPITIRLEAGTGTCYVHYILQDR
ncbi:MAG: hypothetical protein LC634_07390 [Sphingomonadales bacterium]|nr:hypothetical protein [Sphingomonadales bacterium]